MSNTSADNFAKCSHYCYDINPNDDYFGRGRGRWRADHSQGSSLGGGILENENGAGFAKGYTNDSSFCPAHHHPYNY